MPRRCMPPAAGTYPPPATLHAPLVNGLQSCVGRLCVAGISCGGSGSPHRGPVLRGPRWGGFTSTRRVTCGRHARRSGPRPMFPSKVTLPNLVCSTCGVGPRPVRCSLCIVQCHYSIHDFCIFMCSSWLAGPGVCRLSFSVLPPRRVRWWATPTQAAFECCVRT